MDEQHTGHIGLAVEIVAAYVANNSIPPGDLQALITSVHASLVALSRPTDADAPAVEKLTPAQIRKSITNDNLISFEDGKPYKTLRRHLTLRGLTPEAYREKWGLPRDYPMTAPSYSAQRSELARALGLGQQRRKSRGTPIQAEPEIVSPAAEEPAAEKPARGRRRKTEAAE
nr:MucR family transcriptional regulator [Methylobacterium radiodurans]